MTDDFSGNIIKFDNYLEMHLNAFATEGITIAQQESDATFIVFYNSYRLSGDSRPFVLKSTAGGNVVQVQNLPGMEICQDQRIGMDGSGLPRSLVATMDGKKILLLPFAEQMEISKVSDLQTSYKSIEMIPIVEVPSKNPTEEMFSIPAPQSRTHKLLLAYHMIAAQLYDSARKLLHPTTSIHNNQPFSRDELQIILWILRINMESPEFKALRLFIYSHFLINEAKFTFEYDQKSATYVNDIQGTDPEVIFVPYMMSIRELSEKYYIFKLFPEILIEGSTLSRAFFEFEGRKDSKFLVKPSEQLEFCANLPSTRSEYKSGQRETFEHLFYLMNADNQLIPEFKLMKYLLIRNNMTQKFDQSYEMAVYCYFLEPHGIWDEFRNNLHIDHVTRRLNEDLLRPLYFSAMSQCNSKYQLHFEGASLEHLSESTDSRMIQETMKTDLGIFEDYKAKIMDHAVTIETSFEIGPMIAFKESLMSRIKSSDSEEDGFEFESRLTNSSKVLTSLSGSISAFISEKGRGSLKVLKFSDEAEASLLQELRVLNVLFTERIINLTVSQEILLQSLAEVTDAPEDIHSASAHSIENLFTLMHHRKQKKLFSDLYACYLRNSFSCIQKKFPQLNHEQCVQVLHNAVLFFSQQILLDYLKMIQESAKTFLTLDSVPIDDLLIFCNELEKISDFNERIKNPVVMNFEYRSRKYRLKREQVTDIGLLTSIDESNGNFKSIVLQRMMAAGKTLVLGTISVVMKALSGEGRLSILVPPSSLYQSNTSAMQSRTYQYFKKKGNNFSFPRLPLVTDELSGEKVAEFLENVIEIINHTVESRNYLILSPDHLQSFLNSYIEAIESSEILCVGDNYDQYSKILKQFATIYQIFKTRTSIILDEIDMTMDPKKELNFPTIETETYNMTAVVMLADIVEFMLFDHSIIDAGLKIHSNNQAGLTQENYVVCRDIVLAYIETQLTDDTSVWSKFVTVGTVSDDIMRFLKAENISFGKKWIESFYAKEQGELANALIIVKTQLYVYLKDFLGGTVNQNYGPAGILRPQIKYAVPYVAANTPSAGSVFSDRWETCVKTILMISASPCSIETAKDIIKYVRKKIMAESVGKTVLEIKTQPTFLNMSMIVPDYLNILELDENDVVHVENVLRGLVQRSPAAIRIIFSYFINEVLSKMEFSVNQITSNALHMTAMFASVQGYSGTIDNVNILPQRVVSAAAIDHDENEKNNGGIALKLIKDFRDAIVPELQEDSLALSANELVSQFINLFIHAPIENVFAIIDTGAFFKNFKNRQVSEAILRYFKGRIETVLYYNEISNQLEFIRGKFDSEQLESITDGFLDTTDPEDIEKTTQTEIDKRFTFYDQRHITGSDILQPKEAHAIMSVGPRILLRDILQGTLRMRQFMTSQKVHLVITESVRKFYGSKIGIEEQNMVVSDVLTLGALNEDEKQSHENEQLAFGKIDTEIRSFVLDEISKQLILPADQIDIERVQSLYNSCRELFVRSIRENPITWLNEKQSKNTAEILEQHVTLRLSKLSLLFDSTEEEHSRYNNFMEKLGLMYKVEAKMESDSLLRYLKEDIFTPVSNTIGSEVLMQNQTQTLTLIDLDQLVEQINGNYVPIDYKTFDLLRESSLINDDGSVYSEANYFFNLKTIYESQPDSKRDLVKSVLLTNGLEIGVTTDLIQLYEITERDENLFPIFSKFNLEGSHFLVFTLSDKIDKPKVILISPRHAEQALKILQQMDERKYNFWLCDLTGDVVFSVNNLANPIKNILKFAEFGRKLKYLIFDLLIFNGSFDQILAISKLKSIYKKKWMTIADFKPRAVFLRLRMRVLAEKDSEIFDDDDVDCINLKRFSNGYFVKSKSKASYEIDVYAKFAVNSETQSEFAQEQPILTNDESLLESNYTPMTLENYFSEIFENLDRMDAQNEKSLHLRVIDYEIETPQNTDKKRRHNDSTKNIYISPILISIPALMITVFVILLFRRSQLRDNYSDSDSNSDSDSDSDLGSGMLLHQ